MTLARNVKDPKQEYKKEGHNIFAGMMARIRDEVLDKIFDGDGAGLNRAQRSKAEAQKRKGEKGKRPSVR